MVDLMKLNDTITIYHKDLSMSIYKNVYWYGRSGLATLGHGKSNSYSFQVIIPYPIEVSLGDICIRGEGNRITSKSELPRDNIFTIEYIKDNVRGSRLDYIAINGN